MRDGLLPFRAAVPVFAVPVRISLNRRYTSVVADRQVTLFFTFPAGPGFGGDGRVQITERLTDQGGALLVEMANSNNAAIASAKASHSACAQTDGGFALYPLGSGRGLLITGMGTSRVIFIRDGVMYDLLGPAIHPEKAKQLAQALYDATDA
jgi:hypothetical protein